MTFEEEVKQLYLSLGMRHGQFVKGLLQYNAEKEYDVGLTKSTIENALRSDHSSYFYETRKKVVVEYLRSLGARFQSDEPDEIVSARRKMAGDYLVVFDLGYSAPEGHSEVLLGRVLSISSEKDMPSTYRALRYDNRDDVGRKYRGNLEWFPAPSPLSGLFVMEEEGRPAAPSIFLLSQVRIIENPSDTFFFGNATGFIGDLYDKAVSVRALGLPMKWFPFPEPDLLSPETIGVEAFKLIADYLKQDQSGGREWLVTKAKAPGKSSPGDDLSSHCVDIRAALKRHGEKLAAEERKTTSG